MLPSGDTRKAEHLFRALELFEEIDDRALLGATLDVVSSLRGQLDDVEALAYMRRAVSMLRSVEVPYWLGHALQNLGRVLLNLHCESEEAAGLPSEARVLLQDCGDMHCWVLSQAETALGMYHEQALRIVQVIDSLPILPFADTHFPWTLDDCARVLMVAGSYERAAIALGKALHVPLPGEAFIPRETVQEWTRGPLDERLGDAEIDRLLAEGAAMDTDEALAIFRGWLLEVAEAV